MWIGPAVTRVGGDGMTRISNHPDRKAPIEGIRIPGFDQCRERVLELARQVPFCPMVGWDVLMTEQGPVFIEANGLPSFTVLQVHSPLLKDPRARAFFEHWGMVP